MFTNGATILALYIREGDMGMKEKDLEDLLLKLFDTSLPLQQKVRCICATSPGSAFGTTVTEETLVGSTATALDAQIISEPESTIVELTNQLHNTQSEYQQSVERESEYKIRLKRAEEELEQMKSELETCRKSLNCLRQEYAILEERLYGPGNLLERYSDFVVYCKQLQKDGLTMDDFSNYLHNQSSVAVDKKVQNAIAAAMTEINPEGLCPLVFTQNAQ